MANDGEHRLIGGRYRPGAPLGQGGNGYVFAAVDGRTGRTVAVKRVHGADLRSLQRLRREAALLRALDVQGVVRLLDAGEDEEGPYLVLERVEGEHFPGAGCTPDQVVARALAVLAVLEEMHRSGVVHRDVKPSNVLVDDTGRVTLVDFGLARAPGEDALTAPGHVVGTFDFVAPEVWDGAPAGPAADLFGLGVMALRALGGEAVPREPIPAWRNRAARGGLRQLAQELPGIPDAFRATLARLLAPEPTARLVPVAAPERSASVVHLDDARPRRLLVADPVTAAAAAVRELRGRGRRAVLVGPAEGAGASLVAAGWDAPADGTAEAAAAAAQAWLADRLAAGVVLVVAGAPDAWSARRLAGLPAIRLVAGNGRRLSRAALRARFSGEERLLPTRDLAAAALLASTAGLAPLVDAQLDLWARTGVVRSDGAGLVASPTLVRRVVAGLDAGAEVAVPLPPLDRPTLEVLAALVLARPGVPVEPLAVAVARPAWAVEVALQDLARAGLAHRIGARWRDLGGGAALAHLGEDRRRAVEERLVGALPDAHPAVWRHGLLYAGAAAVVALGVRRADALLAAGDALGASAVLADAVLCAGADADVDFAPLVLRVVDLALRAENLSELRRVRAILHYLPSAPPAGRGDDEAPFADTVSSEFPPVAVPLLRLVDAAEALFRGRVDSASASLDHVGPLDDAGWESWRRGLQVRVAFARNDLAAADRVAAEPLPAPAPPDARARMLGLAGLVAYQRLAFGEAARLHGAAARLREAPDLRLSSMLNAASAHLEDGRAERCVTIARRAFAEARRHQLAVYAARAAWLSRRALYASGAAAAPDPGLLDAVQAHDLAALVGVVALQEAAFAWREGCAEPACALARRCVGATLPAPGARPSAVALLARGILAAFRAEPDPDGLFADAVTIGAQFTAQIVELLAAGGHAAAIEAAPTAWDAVPPWRRGRWLEVTWGGPGGRPPAATPPAT